jgi:hypothetical protein
MATSPADVYSLIVGADGDKNQINRQDAKDAKKKKRENIRTMPDAFSLLPCRSWRLGG